MLFFHKWARYYRTLVWYHSIIKFLVGPTASKWLTTPTTATATLQRPCSQLNYLQIIFICILYCNLFCKLQQKRCLCTSFKLKPKVHADIPCESNQIHVVAMLNLSFLTNVEISWIYTYIPNKEKKQVWSTMHMSLSSADTILLQ